MLAKKIKALRTNRESVDNTYVSAALGMPAWEGLAAENSRYATEYDEDDYYLEVDEFGVWRMVPMGETSTYTTSESGL